MPLDSSLLSWALEQWEDPATSRLVTSLRRQACHGDANEMNIMVRPGGAQSVSVRVCVVGGGVEERHSFGW